MTGGFLVFWYRLKVYEIPDSYPTYEHPPLKVHSRGRFSVFEIIDAGFIFVAVILTISLAGALLATVLDPGTASMSSPQVVAIMLLLWIVLAYMALPRLHQLFTFIYVPDYFIGRTKTADGLLGDPVNLAFDGSEKDIHAAMVNAGWTLADPVTLRSSWRIIVSALLRSSYPKAPISDLFLFGQPQTFAYQQEVKGSANRRHHVRFWRVPDGWKLPGGHSVQWLAAGTYDRSVGFSMFTFQVTHKIDEDIDVERDYIVNTLLYCDSDTEVHILKEFSSAYHHRNGGGDRVRTDGSLPVVDVTGACDRQADGGGKQDNNSAAEQCAVVEKRSHRDHRVPPPSLLGAVAFVSLHVLSLALLWLSYAVWEPSFFTDEWLVENLVLASALPVLEAIVLAFTLKHHRWARVVLMILATVGAIQALFQLVYSDAPFGSAILTFISVLLVLAVSGDDARRWTSLQLQF